MLQPSASSSSTHKAAGTTVIIVGWDTATAAVAHALEDAGLRLVRADNPLLVPHHVSRERPSALLVNAEMPAIAGEDVIAILQPERARYPYATYLFGKKTDDSEAIARRCGAQGWLSSAEPPDKVAVAIADTIVERHLFY